MPELTHKEKIRHLKNLMRQLNNTQQQLNELDSLDEDTIDRLTEQKLEKIRQVDKKQWIDW